MKRVLNLKNINSCQLNEWNKYIGRQFVQMFNCFIDYWNQKKLYNYVFNLFSKQPPGNPGKDNYSSYSVNRIWVHAPRGDFFLFFHLSRLKVPRIQSSLIPPGWPAKTHLGSAPVRWPKQMKQPRPWWKCTAARCHGLIHWSDEMIWNGGVLK